MPAMNFVEAATGGSLLFVTAVPGAVETAIDGADEWRRGLRIRVAAEARRGRANDELVKFLSRVLSLDAGDVRIVHGARSHRKTVFIPIAPDKVVKMLGVG